MPDPIRLTPLQRKAMIVVRRMGRIYARAMGPKHRAFPDRTINALIRKGLLTGDVYAGSFKQTPLAAARRFIAPDKVTIDHDEEQDTFE